MHTQSRCVHRNGHAFATAAVVALSLALALSGPARVTAQEALPGAAPVSAGERGPGDEWVRFTLAEAGSLPVAWGASSVLEADTALRPSRYGPEKALDGDIATAWVEGVPGPGSRAGTNAPGEAYYLGTPEIPAALGFHNGYGQSERLFSMNYRVKELAVQIYAAVHVDVLSTEIATPFDARPISPERTIELADTLAAQRVPLPFNRAALRREMAAFQTSTEVTEWQFPLAREHGMTPDLGLTAGFRYIIRVEIVDVYPGSRWEDTCIAEIWPDYGAITAVAVASDDRTLTASFRGAAAVPTYRSLEYALTVVETSDNGEWVILAREPYYDAPRHPTSYALVHAPSGRNVSHAILGKPVGAGGAAAETTAAPGAAGDARIPAHLLPTGFIREGATTYVTFENLTDGTSGRAPCRLYKAAR